MKYSIQEAVAKQAAHHESIEALWNLVWKKRCAMGIYPFMDANLSDFEPIFNQLIALNLRPPYDFDTFASTFFPMGEALSTRAAAAQKAGDVPTARDLYLRAAAVYRIARFPTPQSPKQLQAFARQKDVFFRGAALLSPPIREAHIPFAHGDSEAERHRAIPVCVRVPDHASSDASPSPPDSPPSSSPSSSRPGSPGAQRFPTVVQIYGLDGYRTEFVRKSTDHVRCGWASVAVEIPGTGDCPASASDATAAERLWSSVLEWLREQEWVDRNRIVVWGVSTGGYYAVRLAHTHRDEVAAVVAQGAGVHYMFEPEWLDVSRNLDYPFDLTHCLALKFGYEDVESMKKDSMQRFSLLENGILEKPSARLLVVNGTKDQIFPIEDSILTMQHGSVKEARFLPGLAHMGEPAAGKIITAWLQDFFRSVKD